MLVARMPDWAPEPIRVEGPIEQAMQVEFMAPPPPPTPEPPKPKPETKRIPRPDPTPTEAEPPREPAPPPPGPQTAAAEVQPAQTGPVRVSPGEGPGLIKRVEPTYPSALQAARHEGVVELDAVIYLAPNL